MPRSSCTGALVFDLEIERTTKANKKIKRQEDNSPSWLNISAYSKKNKLEVIVPKTEDMAEQRTLRELTTPNMNWQPSCIEFPNINVAFELMSCLIHLLPTFHGLASEEPHKHLKEFHVDEVIHSNIEITFITNIYC